MNYCKNTIITSPTDDIMFTLEESNRYITEVEILKASGRYDAFVKRVSEHIDWEELSRKMAELEHKEIAEAIDELSDSTIKLSGGKYYVHSH